MSQIDDGRCCVRPLAYDRTCGCTSVRDGHFSKVLNIIHFPVTMFDISFIYVYVFFSSFHVVYEMCTSCFMDYFNDSDVLIY